MVSASLSSVLWTIFLASVGVGVSSFVYHYIVTRPVFRGRAPKVVSGNWPIVGALRFYTHRASFHTHAASKSSNGSFSYHVGRYPVVGLSGEGGRSVFFEDKRMDFDEGYGILFGQSPNTSIDAVQVESWGVKFGRILTKRINRKMLNDSLPGLLDDAKSMFEHFAAAKTGTFDPFVDVYRTVFQFTNRMVGCEEIVRDPKLLDQLLGWFGSFEASTTPSAVLFPWFPSFAVVSRLYTSLRMYFLLDGIVKKRIATGTREDDTLQYLMDEGEEMPIIAKFVISALFAGQINTGMNAAWVFLYLACNPEWGRAARDEVDAVIARHRTSPDETPLEVLGRLTVEQWEHDFPIANMCLHETIRLNMTGVAFRRNISGTDIEIPTTRRSRSSSPSANGAAKEPSVNGSANGKPGPEVIPNGAFVTYLLDDAHMDARVYPDPHIWDPSRHSPERAEGKKGGPAAFLGWGFGRHPCLGMRLAKIEQSVVLAAWLATFEAVAENEKGEPLAEVPRPDRECHSISPPRQPVKLRYTLREGVVF